MPEGFPFPFPFLPGGGETGPQYPGIEGLLDELDRKRRERGDPPIRPPAADENTTEPYPRPAVPIPNIDVPIPPPLPGDVVDPEAPPPLPRTDAENYPYNIYNPPGRDTTASRGPRAPSPPALSLLQRRPLSRSGARARERSRPRKLPGLPTPLAAALGGAFSLPLPRAPRVSSSRSPRRLSFRGPRTTTPRPLETETTPGGFEIPYPYPQKIGKPRDRDERARARVLLDKIHRGESIVPLPDVNPNVPPTRRRTSPPNTSPAPSPSPSLPLPSPGDFTLPTPSIPAPGPITQPNPLPLPAPPIPRIPHPRVPAPPPKTAPRRFKPAVRVAQGLGAASILRPILRRKTGESTSLSSLLQRFTAPFDPVLQPVGSPVAQPAQPSPVAQPAQPIASPLTPANALALSLNPQATGTRRRNRQKDCECEETEEEKKARARPSSKIATVKTFRRRMSQNSLDNLR